MGESIIALLCSILDYLRNLTETHEGGYWQDVVMCLIVLGCSLITYFTEVKITQIWIVEPLGFALGIITAKHSPSIKRWMHSKWVMKSLGLLLISMTCGIAYLKYKPVVFWGDYLLKIVLGAAITAFIFTILSKFRVGNKANGFLGKISYEVYILHDAVFLLLLMIFEMRLESGVYILSAIFIALILAYVLKLVCDPIGKKIRDAWR